MHSADRPRVEIAGELAVFEYVCKCYVNPRGHGSIWQQAGVVRQCLHASGSVRESRGKKGGKEDPSETCWFPTSSP